MREPVKSAGKVQPKARSRRLIVRQLEAETLVYDRQRNRAHCLNPVAAAVWSNCDGTRSVDELAGLDLEPLKEVPPQERRELVRLALAELGQAHLLDGASAVPPPEALLSRRQAIHQLGGAAALPMVASLMQPSPAGIGTPPDPPGAGAQGRGPRPAGPSRRIPGSR